MIIYNPKTWAVVVWLALIFATTLSAQEEFEEPYPGKTVAIPIISRFLRYFGQCISLLFNPKCKILCRPSNNYVMEKAVAANNLKAIGDLNRIGAPPYDDFKELLTERTKLHTKKLSGLTTQLI